MNSWLSRKNLAKSSFLKSKDPPYLSHRSAVMKSMMVEVTLRAHVQTCWVWYVIDPLIPDRTGSDLKSPPLHGWRRSNASIGPVRPEPQSRAPEQEETSEGGQVRLEAEEVSSAFQTESQRAPGKVWSTQVTGFGGAAQAPAEDQDRTGSSRTRRGSAL
ncbi:hypothetical protein D3C72_844380 [compost metagenome]